MDFKIRISNYRSIENESPIELEIKEGITFILGINNVGKSNLLKFFYEFRGILSYPIQHGFGQPFNLTTGFDHLINRKSKSGSIEFDIIAENKKSSFILSPNVDPHNSSAMLSVHHSYPNQNNEIVAVTEILRQILYIGPFRSGISNSSGSNFDVSIGSQFINEWRSWSDGEDISKMQKTTELEEELANLFGFTTFSLRANLAGNNLLVKADSEQFLLTDMGSGISQFIIVLANALIRKPSLILIDEPETNLHPRLQETFVRALASKATYGLIATSHSIGLARSVADQIFSLTKDEKGKSRLFPYGLHFNPTIAQSVSEMNYSQYVEMGGNNILLVEGRTDVKVFREILRKYSIENKFIILSFGGSQFIVKEKSKIIEELSEVNRLKAKSVALIFDSEKTASTQELKGDFKAFQRTCLDLGFKVFATDRHSTENYFTQSAIAKVMGDTFKALAPYEKLESKSWDKNKNWLIVNEMKKEDFEGTGLDKFIKQTLIPLAS
jgi:AAA15 family ATPase/GTPase